MYTVRFFCAVVREEVAATVDIVVNCYNNTSFFLLSSFFMCTLLTKLQFSI